MSAFEVSTSTTKVAWIRDPDAPAGQPALGSFRCICGGKIEGVEFGGPDRSCTCGRTYDGRGWLVTR
jgi:hypothetical protein